MLKYIIKRILWIIPILIGVTIVVFTILYFSPGDPAYLALGDNATPEAVEAYRIEMGINGTYWERLGRTLLGLFQGDLGISYRSRTPVLNELLVRFSVTFNISAWSIVLGIILGIFFGIVAALKQNTILDSLCTGCALFGISMPMFWQGLMLILIFSVGLGWLPASGYGNSWTQMIMPVVALGVNSSATIMRTTRSSMLEVMRQDYIRTARAKGQDERIIVTQHMLRNAMIPVATSIGSSLGNSLGGNMALESVFALPGLGNYVVRAITAINTPAMLGGILFIAIMFTIVNLLVDLSYVLIDPRLKSRVTGKKLSKRAIRKMLAEQEAA